MPRGAQLPGHPLHKLCSRIWQQTFRSHIHTCASHPRSGTEALMRTPECSWKLFTLICMRHFRQAAGTGRQLVRTLSAPSPLRGPLAPPGRSSPSVACPRSGGVGALESAPSWRAEGAHSESSRVFFRSSRWLCLAGPRGPGANPPPPAPVGLLLYPVGCSWEGYDGQGEEGGRGGLPIHHLPQLSLRPSSNIHRAAMSCDQPGGDPARLSSGA